MVGERFSTMNDIMSDSQKGLRRKSCGRMAGHGILLDADSCSRAFEDPRTEPVGWNAALVEWLCELVRKAKSTHGAPLPWEFQIIPG